MLQVGIIGVGRIGQVHIRGILSGVPQAKIRGIAAPHLTPAIRALAQSAGAELVAEDYRALLRGGPSGGKACLLRKAGGPFAC